MDSSQYPAQWAIPPNPSYPQLGSNMEHTLPSSPPLYSGYHLEVRQEPERGKVALGKEKGRIHIATQRTSISRTDLTADKKPVDPPPIVELVVPQDQDRNRLFLQSTFSA